ncbi:MAG: flagellar FlbD family protein [Labilithrix sp.]|nr:flagellar FlbD family protein [Labilithrix sp.]MBX3220533.1 flagellar FlbD family protein [Labilithrix sp.]
MDLAGPEVATDLRSMLKLTRLDHRTVAINPDHIAWVEATPDTTLCLLGDRKVIVRETLDEVVERFVAARTRVGCTALGIQAPPPSNGRRPSSISGRPSGYPSSPPPRILDAHELGFGAQRVGKSDDGGE